MAGTNLRRRASAVTQDAAPSVILVWPQLGENIGAAARAMLNFGLGDLRLVAPRDGWPNPAAEGAASGATEILERARVFATVEAAIADLRLVLAATTRTRYMIKPVLTPEAAVADLRHVVGQGVACGLLFGPERTGLENDHLALADALLAIPANPAFASLNLGMAVLVVAYEWYKSADRTEPQNLAMGRTRPATKAELAGLFEHFEAELDACGFLRPPEKRPSMVRTLRNMLQRAALTEQEVRTLRGVIAGLAGHPPAGPKKSGHPPAGPKKSGHPPAAPKKTGRRRGAAPADTV